MDRSDAFSILGCEPFHRKGEFAGRDRGAPHLPAMSPDTRGIETVVHQIVEHQHRPLHDQSRP